MASEREVSALVRAARRVAGIILRWPTDAHMEQPMGALAQALEAWDVEDVGGTGVCGVEGHTGSQERLSGAGVNDDGRSAVRLGTQRLRKPPTSEQKPPRCNAESADERLAAGGEEPKAPSKRQNPAGQPEPGVGLNVRTNAPGHTPVAPASSEPLTIRPCSRCGIEVPWDSTRPVVCYACECPDHPGPSAGSPPASTTPPVPDVHAGDGAPRVTLCQRCLHSARNHPNGADEDSSCWWPDCGCKGFVLPVHDPPPPPCQCGAGAEAPPEQHRCARRRWPVAGPVPQADGHAEPPDLLPDYVTPLRALAREVLEETCEESAARHHVDVPSVAKPLLELPRDVHRGGSE